MCKAVEKAITERLILRNYNIEMLKALARKKKRLNRNKEKIIKENTRVYNVYSLKEREL